MQTVTLSKGERKFRKELLEGGVRLDGRSFVETRKFTIEQDILPLAATSSLVRWGYGVGATTELYVAVNTEVTHVEPREPSITVRSIDGAFDVSTNVTEVLEVVRESIQSFLTNCHALEPDLFIINKPYGWKLFIDILIIRADGGLHEAAMTGIVDCLSRLEFPELLISAGETVAEPHFQIDPNRLPKQLIDPELLPIVLSYAALGSQLIADPSPAEVTCLSSLVVVGLTHKGELLGLQHFGKVGLESNIIEAVVDLASKTVNPDSL